MPIPLRLLSCVARLRMPPAVALQAVDAALPERKSPARVAPL